MSIHIYKGEYETITELCSDDWDLPTQIDKLEEWLIKDGKLLPEGNYVADIGFGIRKEASGGGAVLNLNTIKMLSDIGMEVYFSEYKIES
ncbi:MAG: hypothetical protein COB15_10995 [Flavobacteriales bacterium]|nr:MAG: hypothetical protein COB15_10995 [Flavobacteriales bacterium]